jgi:hypothetical protein
MQKLRAVEIRLQENLTPAESKDNEESVHVRRRKRNKTHRIFPVRED